MGFGITGLEEMTQGVSISREENKDQGPDHQAYSNTCKWGRKGGTREGDGGAASELGRHL